MLCVHIWRVRKDGFAVRARRRSARSPRKRPTGRAAPGPADATRRTRAVRRTDARSSASSTESRSPPRTRPVDDTVFTWPHLLVRHVVVGARASRPSCSPSAWRSPRRCDGLANPNLTPEPAKAPWYFAGLQELLSHFDPLVAGILVPAGAVLTLVLLPYIDRNPSTVARHRKVAIVVFCGLLVARGRR